MDGKLDFKLQTDCVDKFYRTVFGPSISHTGLCYKRCDHNMTLALRRLTHTRLPNAPGAHQQLQKNQEFAVRNHESHFRTIGDDIRSEVLQMQPYFEEIEAHYADTHEKKLLRIAAWNELKESSLAYQRDTWLKGKVRQSAHATVKLKTMEYAKPGKKPRTIVDLGVAASLLGFRYAEYMKQSMSHVKIAYKGGTMVFCKSPERETLRELFRELYQPPGRFLFIFFSDDAVLSYWEDGVVRWHNLDISSCDASHTQSLFDLLYTITPIDHHPVVQQLLAQCRAPLYIKSYRDRKRKVVLQPKSCKLYSGSTLTTLMNNLANILIMMCIADQEVINTASILAGAAAAGYIVTGEQPLRHYEQVQFLKHSPVDCQGEWRPLLNFGVLFRLSGTCKYDLPGKAHTPLQARAESFQRALLQGAYPYTVHPIVDAMKQVVAKAPLTPAARRHAHFQTSKYTTSSTTEKWDFPRYGSLTKRYMLDESEVDEMIEILGVLKYGMAYASPAFSKVLSVDYGLQCKYAPTRESDFFEGQEYPWLVR